MLVFTHLHYSILALREVIYLQALFTARKPYPHPIHRPPGCSSLGALGKCYLAKGSNDKGGQTTSERVGPGLGPLRLWGFRGHTGCQQTLYAVTPQTQPYDMSKNHGPWAKEGLSICSFLSWIQPGLPYSCP